jgi:bla regulator protein blaR1
MLPWMAYVVIVTLILTLAALAAERALRLRRQMTRSVWATAIIASLLLPTIIASVSIQVPSLTAPSVPHKVIVLRNMASLPLAAVSRISMPPSSSRAGARLDTRLRSAWLSVSGVMVLLLTASAVQLFWRKRRWSRASIAGASVYVAPGVGPAVVGLLRPCIVVPPWVVESSPSCQAHVIAHEQSHLTARDPLLLTAALCLLVFMPWDLPLWWQLRRLRRAIEVDCDARVLNAGHDVNRYGETLIEVGQRQSAFIGAVAAMSESRSFLEQRLRIMIRKPGGWWKTSAALLGCISLCLVTVAAQVSPPNSDASGGQAQTAVAVDPTVYDGLVGHYQFDETILMTVSRDGNRLLTRMTGQGPVEIFPSSRTEYFTKALNVNARLSFETNAQGDATALTLHQNGIETTAPRIDEQVAQQIEGALNARVQSQTADPRSEPALRRYYEGLTAGRPTYDEMTPLLAEKTRENLALLESIPSQFGAVETIDFRGVGSQGWDVYEVRHEHGLVTWRIGMASDGKIKGILAQPGP